VAKVEAPPPGPTIARADLALALLDALDRPDWIGRAIGISS
jgi:putative NADH-flavin reductase